MKEGKSQRMLCEKAPRNVCRLGVNKKERGKV